MKSKIILTLACLLLFGGAIFIYNFVSKKPALEVFLRCPKNNSGKISMTILRQNGERGQTKSFELVNACSVNDLKIEDYQRDEAVEFIFERENGEKYLIISNYGDHIQSDPSGLFVVLVKITETAPFIANDNL